MSRRVLLGFDGFAKYATGLATGLRAAGWEPMLLRRDHDLEFGGGPGAQAAFIAERLGGEVPTAVVPGRVRSLGAVPELLRGRAAVRAFAPDVVHLQAAVGNDPRLPLVATARRGRYAYTCHDPFVHPGDDRLSLSQRYGEQAVVAGAGLIFVHSETLVDELHRRHRVRAPVVVLPHGAGVTPCGEPGDPHTLLFFGRVSHYKGLDVLLDAMRLVWEEVPDARLIAAGQGDWLAHPVLEDPRVEVRDDHVPEEDVPALFGRAGIVVLPYRQASQSGVGSLARQYGRALVVTRAGGLPDLVTEETGRVVEAESAPALARALVALMKEPETVEAMGRAASRELAATASWERVGELTAEAYERHLLAAPRPRATAHRDAVEVADTLDLGQDVLDAWRALAEARENLFLTPEWAAAWQAVRPEEPPLILLWRRDGALRGVLPLVRSARGPLRELRFPGADRGDWFEAAAAPEDLAGFGAACSEALLGLGESWHALALTRCERASARALVPRGSPLALVRMRDDVLPYLEFGPDGWEGFLAARSRNFRSQLGRRERRLAREHDVAYRLTASADELEEDFAWLRRLHDARWEARGGSGWTDDVWQAQSHFARAALARGWLRLWNGEIDGARAASWYGWRVGERSCYVLSGFDPAYEENALGVLLLAHTMREAAAEGAAIYDLLWGDEEYKRRFETGQREVTSYVVTRRRHPLRAGYTTVSVAMEGARRLPPRAQEPLRWVQERRWRG